MDEEIEHYIKSLEGLIAIALDKLGNEMSITTEELDKSYANGEIIVETTETGLLVKMVY